jgi:hypothetical protein
VRIGSEWTSIFFGTSVSGSAATFQFNDESFMTGDVFWFCEVNGMPKLALGVLFVCCDETKTLRAGIWHLRKGLSVRDEELSEAMAFGRSGTFVRKSSV